MVEVEQRALRAFEEDALAAAKRAIDEQRRVRDVRGAAAPRSRGTRRRPPRRRTARAVHALEPDVLLLDRELELLAQDLRVEQVLDADADPRRLVGVGGTDPAPRRADLEPTEPALARAVERDVPGHDEMRVPGHEEQALGDMPAGLELVQLGDQDGRIDHAAGADRARLSGHDPARNLPNLVRLPGDDDGVPGIRAALVTADEVGVLGEQVDDLPLPLVAPLRPDDHGRGHMPSVACAQNRVGSPTAAPIPQRPPGALPCP